MKKNILGEAFGWYGTCAILLAYTLVSFEVILASSFSYQFLNFTGALGVAFISLQKKAYSPATLNIIWAVIALVALAMIFL